MIAVKSITTDDDDGNIHRLRWMNVSVPAYSSANASVDRSSIRERLTLPYSFHSYLSEEAKFTETATLF